MKKSLRQTQHQVVLNHLSYVRFQSRGCTHMNFFNLFNNAMKWVLVPPLYTRGKCNTEKLSKFTEIILSITRRYRS